MVIQISPFLSAVIVYYACAKIIFIHTQQSLLANHFFFFFFFFLSFIYFTLFREKDKADMNSLRWSAPVELEPAYTRMWVARSTTVLRTPLTTSVWY